LGDPVRDESNPYESPKAESEKVSKPRPPRTKPQTSAARLAFLSTFAVVASFFLLQLWGWTAQLSWSSDTSLLSIPAILAIVGILAFVALAVVLMSRRR
jgi:hypothetical protein